MVHEQAVYERFPEFAPKLIGRLKVRFQLLNCTSRSSFTGIQAID